MTQYAARYRAARGFAGLTQEALAHELGVEVQTIKRRESGEKEPKKAELIAVAAICGVPLEFMEHGWGRATPDELGRLVAQQNTLLGEQTGVLNEIRAAVSEQRQAKTETEEATARLLAAAETARLALRPATQSQEAAPGTRAT